MSFEVTCGQCSGRLTVEQAGVVVACPHCGAHLNIADPNAPDEAPAPAPQPAVEATASPPEPAVAPAPVEAPAGSVFPGFDPGPQAEAAPDFSGGIPGFDPSAPLPATETAAAESATPEPAVPQISMAPEPASPQPAELAPAPSEFTGISTEPAEATPQISTEPATVDPAAASPELAPAPTDPVPAEAAAFAPTQTSSAKSKGSVPKKVFLVVASYASAMTIAAVWLLMKVLNPTANTLENLPDLEPKRDSAGQIGLRLVPEEAPMPLGHELKLGDEQRFGNLKVTALRVTRGPLEFSHYDPDVTDFI